jgi:hypothetical protein
VALVETMKLTLYTAMRNCVRNGYPFVEMLRHHLPLADEIVINEGHSTDGTYEQIEGLHPKIRIFRSRWKRPTGEDWWIHFKDEARRAATGDWCIHLDADEFIPEWEFDTIRDHLATTSDQMIPVRFINFYANYRVYHSDSAELHKVTRKMIIHRNTPEIEFWGDGSNVKRLGQAFSWETSEREFTVHHFGSVRHPGAMRYTAWAAGRFRTGRSSWWRPPRAVFDLFPHDWMDLDYLNGLAIYEGPLIAAVMTTPHAFVWDNMQMYDYLLRRRGATPSSESGSGVVEPGAIRGVTACSTG